MNDNIGDKVHTTHYHQQEIDYKIDGHGLVDVFSFTEDELPTNRTHQVRQVMVEEIDVITNHTRPLYTNLLLKGGAHAATVTAVEANTAMLKVGKDSHEWMTLYPDEVSVVKNPQKKAIYGNPTIIKLWENCYVLNIYERRDDYDILPAILEFKRPRFIDEDESDRDADISQMTNHFGSVLVYNDPNGFSVKNNVIKMVYVAGFGWNARLKKADLESVTLIPIG